MRKFPVLTSGVIVLLALAGCGAPQQESPPPGGSPSMEATAGSGSASPDAPTSAGSAAPSGDAMTPSGTTTPDEDSDSASPSGTDDSMSSGDAEEPSEGAEATPGGVLPPDVKGQTLALADFFNPNSDWTEGRYNVADQGSVSGIAREINSCGLGNSTPTLELRLANNFENLKFKVGQDNNSASSDKTLTVRVEGNGKQLDVQSIPFNEVRDFSVPVKDVNALKIQFYLEDQNENCYSGSLQAVIYDVELQ